MFLNGCSSSKWVVQSEVALDKSDGELKSASQYVEISDWPTPDRPVVTFDLYDRNEYIYPARQTSRRYVQHYRPRYSYLLLGLSGAALAFYLANSSDFVDESLSRNEKIALNSAGGVIALASFLNMKPVGEPLETGENTLLKSVGETTVIDTAMVTGPEAIDVSITAWHNNDLLKSDIKGTFQNGTLNFNLIDKLELSAFEGAGAGKIYLEMDHDNSTYTFQMSVNSFMKKFVAVNKESTPLRSDTEELPYNIITNIGIGSQFPLLEKTDENWYRVLYGISPAYVSVDDASTIWLPIGINAGDLIMAPEESTFGDIEVERNIPETEQKNPGGIAVLIGNGTYEEPLPSFDNAGRSLELMESYITKAMGYSPKNVVVMENATKADFQKIFQQSDSTMFNNRKVTDTTDVFIYYMGHALASRRNESEGYLLPSDFDISSPYRNLIAAKEFFSTIGSLKTRSTTVLMETDFVLHDKNNEQLAQNPRGRILLRELASHVTANNPNAAVYFAASHAQQAGKYASLDGRMNNEHGVFTYHFCKALKDGRSTTGSIYRSLQRNISFTSRRIYDRAQDPKMFGNPSIWLIPEAN
ncbi:MAG: caspase family protein [Balneolales bacterium]